MQGNFAASAGTDGSMTHSEGFLRGRDGHRLYYRIDGAGPVVAIAPLACWLADDLAGLGAAWTLVTFDPRGRGRSDALQACEWTDLQTEITDLEDVCTGLDLGCPALIGWGYHAGVVAHFTALHPQRAGRCLFIAPWPLRRDPYMVLACRTFLDRLDPDAVTHLERLNSDGLEHNHPCAYARRYHRVHAPAHMANAAALDRMRSDPFALPNEWLWRVGPLGDPRWLALQAWDWHRVAETVTAPTLCVHGLRDAIPVEASREWALASREAKLVILTDAGHYPWLECPETFATIAGAFLRG
jgi:pimeloyl-ACP methyl ester carboxylesterase